MKNVCFLFFLFISCSCYGQITVDTSGGNVIVKEKTNTVTKSLSIYKSFVPHRGKCNLMVYDHNSGDYGDEPDTLYLSLATELPHVKTMLDAAMKYKRYNFYRFAFDIAPYKELMSKLVDIYGNSKEWNDYLQKAGNLQLSTTLYDGNEVSEIAYDKTVAGNILVKSDFVQALNDFFKPYGYKVAANGFPDDHKQIVSRSELRSLGKPESLFIPIPNSYFTLTKIK